MIRGEKLFGPSFYTGRATFVYGSGNFLVPHFIRGRELFCDHFFFTIRGSRLFGSSFVTGRTTFVYGAANFLDRHFIWGRQLFFRPKNIFFRLRIPIKIDHSLRYIVKPYVIFENSSWSISSQPTMPITLG